ncbi:hypothetical protein EJB05_29204, partial [Eragrostis curvula]
MSTPTLGFEMGHHYPQPPEGPERTRVERPHRPWRKAAGSPEMQIAEGARRRRGPEEGRIAAEPSRRDVLHSLRSRASGRSRALPRSRAARTKAAASWTSCLDASRDLDGSTNFSSIIFLRSLSQGKSVGQFQASRHTLRMPTASQMVTVKVAMDCKRLKERENRPRQNTIGGTSSSLQRSSLDSAKARLMSLYSGRNSELRPCHKDSIARPCATNLYMLLSVKMAQSNQSGFVNSKARVPFSTPAPTNFITFATSVIRRSRSTMLYPER